MPGPTTGISFSSNLLAGIEDIKTRAKEATRVAKAAQSEMKALSKAGKEASAEFKNAQAEFVRANEIGRQARGQLAGGEGGGGGGPLSTLTRLERGGKALRGAGRGLEHGSEIITDLLNGNMPNPYRVYKLVKHARHYMHALEKAADTLGETIAKNAILRAVSAPLVGVAATAGVLWLAKKIHDEAVERAHKINEKEEEMVAHINPAKGTSFEKDVGDEIRQKLNENFNKQFGKVSFFDEKKEDRAKFQEEFTKMIEETGQHSDDAIRYLQTHDNTKNQQLAQIDASMIKNQATLEKALADSKNITAVTGLMADMEKARQEQELRENDQKFMEQMQEVADPTYGARMRQSKETVLAYEKESMRRFQDWSSN